MDEIKNKRKELLENLIILLVVAVFVLVIVGFYLIKNKNNKVNSNNVPSITEQLYIDYNQGIISTDEYVRYMLYSEYDMNLLNDKYKFFRSNSLIHTDELINEYYDELSDETLKYYLGKINLDDVTFELNNENIENNKFSFSDLIVDKVYAKAQNVTNLNKVVLSKNGNFIVWYTTTGDSATDYESAKKVADGLEYTVEQYERLFGYKYKYSANIVSKGNTYNNQKKILENNGINSTYLESAMQVYLINYSDSSLAKYVGKTAKLGELFNKFKGGDSNGAIIDPYILIKPSSFDDFERLEQLYNHELFHHYQHSILCGSDICEMGSDPYIGEATANWASSLTTKKTNDYGFLNEWAGTARSYSNVLMGKDFVDKYSAGTVGYALFVYLNNYSSTVNDGTTKIIKSMYEDDSLKYLSDNAEREQLANIQENIALKNLTQDYSNKNLNADKNFGSKVPIESIISSTDSSNNLSNFYKQIRIPQIGVHYYLISDNSKHAFKIELTRDNYYISIYIISKKDGKYSIVDSSKNSNQSITFDTNKYGDFDSLYIAISNNLLHLDNYYTLNIENTAKQQDKVEKNDLGYISLLDCDATFDEEKEKMIDTYYYDKQGNINKWLVTIYWNTEQIAKENYENNKNNKNYTNVKINGKVVSFEYTNDALLKYFPGITKESVVKSHNMSCSGDATVNFNPS